VLCHVRHCKVYETIAQGRFEQYYKDQFSPRVTNPLLQLRTVFVRFGLICVELTKLIHRFSLFLSPNTLEVVDVNNRASRKHPPKFLFDAHDLDHGFVPRLLDTVNVFDLIDESLVVFDDLIVLLQ